MTARVIPAASASDGASSFAYAKPQSKQSAADGDSTPKFSQMMRDSASETKTAPTQTTSIARIASRDNSPALQHPKQDKRSQSTQAGKATDTSKKDKAEATDSGQGTVVTAPQPNDRSPLTMLFGMPTAKFDSTVSDGQESLVDASAKAASTAEGAPTDAEDKMSSDLGSLISDRSPLAMLFGMRNAQFGNTVINGQDSKAGGAPKGDGEATPQIDSSSRDRLPLTTLFDKSDSNVDANAIHDETSNSPETAQGSSSDGSINQTNINDVALPTPTGDAEPNASTDTAVAAAGLQVDDKAVKGGKAPASVPGAVKIISNGSDDSELALGAAPKGSIKPTNMTDVAPAAQKHKGEQKTLSDADSSTPDRLPLTMPFGMPTPLLDSNPAEGASDATSTVKNTSPNDSFSDPSISNGTGNKAAAAIQADKALSAAQASDSKRRSSSGTDSPATDRLPLVMPFGTSTPQLESKVSEEASNAPSTVTSTSNDGGGSELSTNAATGKESAAAMHANNLAFAMRVSEGELKTSLGIDTSAAAPPSTAGDAPKTIFTPSIAPIAVEAGGKSDLEQNSHDTNASQQQPFVVDPALTRTNPSVESAPPPSEQLASTVTYTGEDVSESVSSEPVKNVRMQLVGEDNKRVDVRLFDRGGELHVSVKSGDVNLTQDLQTHMHDLTSRLEKQNLQTEVWVPKVAESTKTESGNTNGFSFDRENRSSSGNSDERRRGRQQQKPEWLESLES